MSSYSTSEFKSGLKVLIDSDPCSIMENEMVKPGKGQAFNRVKYRNLKNGRVMERTFKSGEYLPGADVLETDMEFVYEDGEFWHFMKTDGSFEQIAADKHAVSESKDWLKEQNIYHMILWNEVPITVSPPNFIELDSIESANAPCATACIGSNCSGDFTSSGATRVAKVEV